MLDVVRSWVGQLLDGEMDDRMQKSLASFVAGIIESKSLVAAEIGRNIPSDAYEKHKIKQADRFLGNPRFDDGVVSRALLRNFAFVPYQRVVLTLDWTKLGDSCWLMTTSVVMGGRALPFQWTAINQNHTRLAVGQKWHVDKLVAMLPKNVCFVLLFDAGYDDGEFIKYLTRLHLKFIVRSSPAVCILPVNEEKWLNLQTFSLLRGRVQDWGQVQYTKSHRVSRFASSVFMTLDSKTPGFSSPTSRMRPGWLLLSTAAGSRQRRPTRITRTSEPDSS